MQKKILLTITIISVIIITILFFLNLNKTYLPQYDLKESQITKERIIAPFTFRVRKTEQEIEEEKISIKKNVKPIYQISNSRTFNAIKNLDYIFSQIDFFSSDIEPVEIAERMKKTGFEFSLEVINLLYDKNTRNTLHDYLSKQINSILDIGVYSDNIKSNPIKLRRKNTTKLYAKRRLYSIEEAISKIKRNVSAERQKAVEEIANYVINANIVEDAEATNKLINEKISAITPYKGQVLKDEEIIGKNKKITAEKLNVLNSLIEAYENSKIDDESHSQIAFIFRFILLFIMLYSVFYSISKVQEKKLEFKVYLFIYITLFLDIFLLILMNHFTDISLLYYPYIFFILIFAIVISPGIAILANFVMLILASLLLPGSFNEIYMHALVSYATILWIEQVFRERHSYVLIGLILFLNSAIIITLWSIATNISYNVMFEYIFFALIANIITIILIVLFTPSIERRLSITTDERLYDLIDYKNKLLKRLATQAPGTYYHSLNVGGIAENAAEAIGANAILARVSGYYHDIGKLESSDIFSENNIESSKTHDMLMPQESAGLIRKHISHGAVLAKKYNLPKEIIDVIKQHHGTGPIKYFLHKAKEANLQIDEDHFNYPGPIPQTKEAALVMISDIVESTTKSKKKLNNEVINEVINKTIDDLIKRKQLVDSGLTLKDIELIKSSLVFSIEGIYGARVEYPDENNDK